MKVEDQMGLARGVVSPSFLDISTGKMTPFSPRHNTLSFMAAEAVAAAFGGDPSYIPARMGIIYGDKSSISFESISRDQSWGALVEDIESSNGDNTVDIQVVGFSYAPSLGGESPAPVPGSSGSGGSSDPYDGDYNHILSTGANAITFHAVSNSQDQGEIMKKDVFTHGSYIYQCVLLGYHQGEYYVIARASLKDSSGSGEGVYLTKPSGFEVALDWTIVFH